MKFTIPCATYLRLSAVCQWAPDKWANTQYIRSLYVERRNGHLIAVATNVKVAVIELLSSAPGPDEHAFVTFDDALLQQAETESAFASYIEFDVMPDFKFGTAKTMMGWICPNNVGVFPTDAKIETMHWRDWLPEKLPTANYGQLQIDASILQMLAKAAPSSQLVFHTHIDTRLPSVVRDKTEKNWFGVFMPAFEDGKPIFKVEIPNW